MDNSNLNHVKSLAKELGKTFKAEIKPLLAFAGNEDLLEVPDPYYGGDKGFDKVLDLLDVAVNGLLEDIKVA